jgi:hypothetical protein
MANTISTLTKRFFLLIVPVLLLSACAVSKQHEMQIAAPAVVGDAKNIGWRKVSFEMAWPENQEPSWYMDVLLAHRVIAPVLERYRRGIEFWRFHRRAKRDSAGHRFSFIFYGSAATATQIFAAIKAQPSLQKLLSEERLVRAEYDNPQSNDQPGIENASDAGWPLMVQKTWPSFIMGASEMWLGLIREIAAELQSDAKPDDDMLYRNVQTELSSLWREQGQHPYLHHLNALFGYQEMIVIDRNGKAMRF